MSSRMLGSQFDGVPVGGVTHVSYRDLANFSSGDFEGTPVDDVMDDLQFAFDNRAVEHPHGRDLEHGGPRNYVNHLKKQISRHGMQTPIEVTVSDEGHPEIYDGHHRAAAAIELGMRRVPVKRV